MNSRTFRVQMEVNISLPGNRWIPKNQLLNAYEECRLAEFEEKHKVRLLLEDYNPVKGHSERCYVREPKEYFERISVLDMPFEKRPRLCSVIVREHTRIYRNEGRECRFFTLGGVYASGSIIMGGRFYGILSDPDFYSLIGRELVKIRLKLDCDGQYFIDEYQVAH